MLLFAIGFNLWLYRMEPTATIDPNDNPFQYALVHRTNDIWNFATKTCPQDLSFPICHFSYLVDHWVPNWAEGYNLPFYYSHLPQIAIVASYKLFTFIRPGLAVLQGQALGNMSLFQYYHWIIYLLLSFFPLSVFVGLRVISAPWLIAGFGALIASHLSTDGLYGLDPPSFLWRGYGLSSQLFAMIWLPQALAYSYKFFVQLDASASRASSKNSSADQLIRTFGLAVFFTTLTTSGHLGIGIMTIMSLGIFSISEPFFLLLNKSSLTEIIKSLIPNLYKLILLAGTVIFFLSYWIVPLLLNNDYHNISFWDPVWKFDSYGAGVVLTNLFNGALFDFGRSPWITIFVLIGVFFVLVKKHNLDHSDYEPKTTRYETFSLLFIFWLLMYFGRTTWGGLIDLIPGMKEFHLSRFLVGVQISGLFLAPLGLWWLIESLTQKIITWLSHILDENKFNQVLPKLVFGIWQLVFGLILLIILPPIYRQTIEYSRHNDRLIRQANENHTKVRDDETTLFTTLRSLPPGRIFAGRGGGYGKDFQIAETPYYMHISTYGLPSTLWLPETWSPNSDIEQYFSEDQLKDYQLFGIRYALAPPDLRPQPFWRPLKETNSWKLYEIPSVDYFTSGIRPAIVAADKQSFINLVRLWIQTDQTHVRGLYPQLTFNLNDYPQIISLPNFKMLDEANYIVPDGSTHNIFQEPPVYLPPGIKSIEEFQKTTIRQYANVTIKNELADTDMIFTATAEVQSPCRECLVVLKQTFHPNWRATVDGKPAETFTVFPFYIGVQLDSPGAHTIKLSYQPSSLKINLLVVEFLGVILFFALAMNKLLTKP